MEPRVIAAQETRSVSLYDVRFRYGPAAADTDGRVALLEVTIPPRTLVKPHQHSREDEFTLVVVLDDWSDELKERYGIRL